MHNAQCTDDRGTRFNGPVSIDATLDRIQEIRLLAVLRGPDEASTLTAIDTLVSTGITGIEVTFSTPDAEKVIASVRERHADRVLVGAGTVLTREQGRAATGAGAEFVVSPGTDPELLRGLRELGVPVMAGTLTPSEVMVALRLGADVIKLFPASLGGPAYLRSLRGPFPDVPFMPTGGVTGDNLATWLDAGAIAVGAGSDLISSRDIASGDHDAIAAKARKFVAALREWSGGAG